MSNVPQFVSLALGPLVSLRTFTISGFRACILGCLDDIQRFGVGFGLPNEFGIPRNVLFGNNMALTIHRRNMVRVRVLDRCFLSSLLQGRFLLFASRWLLFMIIRELVQRL